jgi:hypothetical protein
MLDCARPSSLAVFLAVAFVLLPAASGAQPVTVRQPEGVLHGFLALRTLEGDTLASGDLTQFLRGGRVTSRLLFAFKDGSVHDETVVFKQQRRFEALSYKLVQKGPAFTRPMEVSFDGANGHVTVRHTDEEGKENVESERVKVPPDLANGMVPILLKNSHPEAPPTVSLLAATPKPRLVKLAISSAGEERFLVAGSPRRAIHYVVKVEIGGVAGLLAPLLGKQPPDTHMWIMDGEAPAFVKSEGPLFLGGPVWRIEIVSPTWPDEASTKNPS